MSKDNGARSDDEINESLAIDTKEIAEAITGYLIEMGTLQRRGFALFLAEYGSGHISYISNINHDDAIGMIAAWIDREKQ